MDYLLKKWIAKNDEKRCGLAELEFLDGAIPHSIVTLMGQVTYNQDLEEGDISIVDPENQDDNIFEPVLVANSGDDFKIIPADYDIKEEITHVDILDESGYKSFSKIVGKVKEIMYVKGIQTDEGDDDFWSLTISVFGCDFSALLPDNFDNSNLEMGAYISGIFSVVSF